MPVCLWKDCEFAFEELAAFQAHVITKHALQQQPQQQQLNLDNQNGIGINREDDHGGPIAKKAKMNGKEGNNMINRGGQRKIIFLAVEVWVDVLGFVKRIRLARTVSLTNWHIYQICWPRLHGDKVVAHPVRDIIIGYDDESGHTSTALLLEETKKVPFPECPVPDYITGFGRIKISFLDHQVLAFVSLIAPRITTSQVGIQFTRKMSNMDENKIASLNRLLQLCKEKMTTTSIIHFLRCMSNIQFLPDVDNKMKRIHCHGIEESDIPILMQFLASPRPDGQQRVMMMHFSDFQVVQKLLEAIKEEFRTSTQPLPQPFVLQFLANNIGPSVEQNPLTHETLTIVQHQNWGYDICRHPRGQHEQWAEDARKRLNELPINNITTWIHLNISEFGKAFCSP